MRRRLLPLGLILLAVALIWSVAWFAAASWTEGRVGTALAELARRGIDVECPERDVVGFPFALKVACGAAGVSDRASGSAAELAGLTGGATLLSPMTAEIELASPARLQSPALAAPADLRWEENEVNVGMGLNGPRSVSFDAAGLAADLALPEFGAAQLAAASAEGSLAPAADGGTNAALVFTGLALAAGGTALPPFDGSASAALSAPPRALLSGRAGLQAPLAARDLRIALTSGGGRLDAEGELSVDGEGILDGAITLRIAGAEALAAYIAALPPERQKLGNAVVGGMLAFGKTVTVDGKPASELLIEIERGRARVGPVDFRLPRLPL